MKFSELVAKQELLINRAEPETDDLALAPIFEELGYGYHALERYDEAIASYEKALAIRQAGDQCGTLPVLTSTHALGLIYRLSGQYHKAEYYYKSALSVCSTVYGATHIETCTRRNFLSGLYYAWKLYADAAELIEESCEIYVQQLGPDHAAVNLCFVALGLIGARQGESAKAAKYLAKSQRVMEAQDLGMEDRDELMDDILQFVHFQISQDKLDDAEALFRFVLMREAKQLWPSHPMVADNLRKAAELQKALGHEDSALQLYQESLHIYVTSFGLSYQQVVPTADALGTLLAKTGRDEEAMRVLKLALESRDLSSTRDPDARAKIEKLYESVKRKTAT
jgi:tetratricopeptide (TPR) repeat protein